MKTKKKRVHKIQPQDSYVFSPCDDLKNKIQFPDMDEGEVYLISRGTRDYVMHHTILVPGEAPADSWEHQLEWARDNGGDLLDRIEWHIAYDHHRALVQPAAYWTNAEFPEQPELAWCHNFLNGVQGGREKSDKLFARRVRRVSIQMNRFAVFSR